MKYQLDNPNGARAKIDFNNPNNPVKFEYVGKETPFKICFKFFRTKIIIYFSNLFFFIFGILYAFIFTQSLQIRQIFLVRVILFFIFYFYIVPFLLALLFSKTKLIRLMPKLWAIGHTKFIAEFNKDHIIDNKIEIPLFGNQFLHYKLEGDFLDKIDTIEIIEHPFNVLKIKGKNKKLLPNEYLWKAIFTFNKIPKDGQLKVIFV